MVFANDGGRNRLVATLGPGQFEASWFIAAPGPLTVAVTPGAAGTPGSVCRQITS